MLPARRTSGLFLGGKEVTHGIYIEIVLLTMILALEGRETSDASILAAVLGALAAVFLAELYVLYLGGMVSQSRQLTAAEIGKRVKVGGVALIGAVPPLLFLVFGAVGLIRLSTSFDLAKWAGAAVIGLYAYYASRRAGFSTTKSVVSALCFGAVGVGLVVLKHYFK